MGDARGVPARDRRALRPAASGRACSATRPRSSCRVPRPPSRPGGCSTSARPACGSCRSRRARRSAPRRAAGAAREAERLGLGDAVRRVCRPLRRPPGPADAARGPRAAGRRAVDGARGRRLARRRGRRASASWARRPMTAPRCRGPRRARASPTRWPMPRGCRPSGSRRSSPGRGSSSSRPTPSRPASPRSRRSRRACRSWPAPSGVLPEVVGRGRHPRGARRPGAARDGARRGLGGRRPPRAARRRGPGAARDDAHLVRRGVGHAGGLGGRRPAGAVPLAAGRRGGASATRPAPRGCRGRRCSELRDLALLDRRLEALGDHLDERLARR